MDWYAQQQLEERRLFEEEESRDTRKSSPALQNDLVKERTGNDTPGAEVKQDDSIPY